MKPLRSYRLAQSLLVAALLLGGTATWADLELADKSACLNCHAVDKKSVGPSFKAIADKYRNQPGTVALLVGKVEKGGQGVWGSSAMPGMGYLPKDDIAALVNWIVKTP